MPKWKVPYKRVTRGEAVVVAESAIDAAKLFNDAPYHYVDQSSEADEVITLVRQYDVEEVRP